MIIKDPRSVLDRLHVRPPRGVDGDAVVGVLAESGVLLDGHFVLQSGAHSPSFIRFSRLGWDRPRVRQVARWLLAHSGTLDTGTVVLCPESAGFLLGDAVAAELGTKPTVVRVDEARRPTTTLRDKIELKDRPVLVVNDVATTGTGLLALADLAVQRGGRVVGALVLATLNTARVEAALRGRGYRGEWLAAAAWRTFSADECPQCARGEPSLPAAELN